MNVITQKPHLMLIQLVAFCASFSVSLASPEAYEYPGALHAIGDGSTLYGEIELQGFDAIEDPKGIHAGAPFSLCQLDADPYPEILVKSYNSGQPGKRGVKLYAYDHDGVQLWMREMGGENRNYGAWSPVIACDLDQDGLDEIYAYNWEKGGLCELIQINILDGTTSRQTSWPGAEAMAPGVMPWRGALMIAQLSPGVPSLVAITGYQGDAGHYVIAYDAQLKPVASFTNTTGLFQQGSHQYIAADFIGDDEVDELFFGTWYLRMVDGELQLGDSIELPGHNHADALQVGDFDPTHPGYEVWLGSDRGQFTGLLDKDFEWIWSVEKSQQGQAVHGDLVPSAPGWETALDFDGGHGDPPKVTRRVRFANGQERSFAELGLDELSVEHHNLQSDFPHWNRDYRVSLLQDISGLVEQANERVLFRMKGDYFGDGREEVLLMDGNILKIFSPAGEALPRASQFREDRKYRQDLRRGSRHFSAFHYTAPMPLEFIPTVR